MQKKSLRLFFSVVMTSVALGLSHSGRADCDPMAVRQILEDGGWRFEAETDENGQGVFTITSDGITARAAVERDGDAQFMAFYVDTGLTRQESLELINEASSRLKYVQIWLDEDEDLAVMYSVAEWNNVCPDNLTDHIRLFFSLMRSVQELHPES